MDNNQPQEPTTNTVIPSSGELPASRTNAVSDPIRSRWTPKPEQILILESIFNSGMVNPPREETVRIRKLLEKFGSVGDANVFYWFQNRRSRSRRRQRQLQASLAAAIAAATSTYESTAASCSSSSLDAASLTSSFGSSPSSSSPPSSMGSVWCESADDLFSISQQMGFGDSTSSSNRFYEHQPGTVTVFINEILTEVPRGPIDIRSMFGHDVLIVHSSGEFLPVNEYGILLQSLQMGESYYLIARPN
ncbi:LOW QUALITY PROTEIN: WUSCHEL-related homeobox 11-like [Phalaenopsis equestris]|uniref:LOW QUALITY PROTEIN: WUSCHEL-related homeobox 11-like n=1 Tax=Phalaenopsis equestris TaxID=78828 RepID=UPI0009E50DBF|nr:LOW QUALITY PROTEIN: WUSCHEL-related homeobox 11-like [Phalaenopsis equestris]